jgi:hypothetical protein
MTDARVNAGLAGIEAYHSATQTAVGELLVDLRSAPGLRTGERDAASYDGSKGAAVELIVSLGASGTIASFVKIIQLWLGRDRRRTVTVTLQNVANGKTITIEGDNISIDTVTAALGSAVELETVSAPEAGTRPKDVNNTDPEASS